MLCDCCSTGAKSCSLPFVLHAIADARLERSMLSEEQLVAAGEPLA